MYFTKQTANMYKIAQEKCARKKKNNPMIGGKLDEVNSAILLFEL